MKKYLIFILAFSKVYSMSVQKAKRKDRTQAEVDQVICWLTGYDAEGLRRQIEQETDFETKAFKFDTLSLSKNKKELYEPK